MIQKQINGVWHQSNLILLQEMLVIIIEIPAKQCRGYSLTACKAAPPEKSKITARDPKMADGVYPQVIGRWREGKKRKKNKKEQAGAELCQAQQSLSSDW